MRLASALNQRRKVAHICCRCCATVLQVRFGGPAALQPGIRARIAVVAGQEAARLEFLAQQENGEHGGEAGRGEDD